MKKFFYFIFLLTFFCLNTTVLQANSNDKHSACIECIRQCKTLPWMMQYVCLLACDKGGPCSPTSRVEVCPNENYIFWFSNSFACKRTFFADGLYYMRNDPNGGIYLRGSYE